MLRISIFILMLLTANVFTIKWFRAVLRHAGGVTYLGWGTTILLSGIIVKFAIVAMWYIAAGGLEINPSLIDILHYDGFGRIISDSFAALEWPDTACQKFSYFVGILYLLFGKHHIVVSFYNVLLTILMSVMVLEVTLKISRNVRAAFYAFVVTLLFPQFISSSYYVLKDITAVFLTVAVVWSLFCIEGKLNVVVAMIFLMLEATVRTGQAILLGVLISLTIVLRPDLLAFQGRTKGKRIASLLVLIVASTAFVIITPSQSPRPASEFGITTLARDASGENVRVEASGQGVIPFLKSIVVNPLAFTKAAIQVFIRIFYGPFYLYADEGGTIRPYDPNEVGFRAVLESISGAPYTGLLMPMILFGFCHMIRRDRKNLVIWAFVLCWIIVMIYSGHAVTRWRLPVFPFLFILFGIGFEQMHQRWKQLYSVYFLCILFFLSFNATRRDDFILAKAVLVAIAAVFALRMILSRLRVAKRRF